MSSLVHSNFWIRMLKPGDLPCNVFFNLRIPSNWSQEVQKNNGNFRSVNVCKIAIYSSILFICLPTKTFSWPNVHVYCDTMASIYNYIP